MLTVVHPKSATRQDALRDGIRRAEAALREGAPLRTCLAHLTAVVEKLAADDVVASILVLDRNGLLRNGASPHLPADYLKAIDRIKPDADMGTCAAAAARGECVFTPDFTEDHCWAELRHLPMAIGFVGAWSCPIKSAQGGQVLGTFGTYFREKRMPTEDEVALVQALAPVAARMIEARA